MIRTQNWNLGGFDLFGLPQVSYKDLSTSLNSPVFQYPAYVMGTILLLMFLWGCGNTHANVSYNECGPANLQSKTF